MNTKTNIRISDDLYLPLDVVTQKLAFLGTSGSGKSFGAMKLAEGMLDCDAQIIPVDPVGIWWSLRLLADGKREGYKQVRVFGGDHGDLPLTPQAGTLIGRILAERRISAVLDVSQFTTSEMKRFLTDFAEQFFQSKKKHKSPVHLFLEECQTYIPQDKTDREDPLMLNRWERLIKFFRNYGGGTTMISQQPQSVNKKCLNLADTLFAFRTIGSHERKAIMSWVKDVVETEVDLVKSLPKLPTGTAHIWSPSWLGISRDIKIRRKKTFDAGKTPEMGVDVIEPKPLTRVDVKQLESEMAEMIEKVKQDDPHELRKRIAELEKKIGKPASVTPEVKAGKVEKLDREKMIAAQRAEIERLVVNGLRPQVRKAAAPFNALPSQLREAADRVEKIIGVLDDEKVWKLEFISDKGVRELTKAITEVDAPRLKEAPAETPRIVKPRDAVVESNGDLSGPEQRILNAIAWMESIGVRNPMQPAVSFLAGYKYGTGGFNNPRGSLRVKGLIEYTAGNTIVFTDAGRAKAHPPSGDLNSKELQRRILDRLPGPEKRILTVLIEAYPESLTHEKTAELSNYAFKSGAYNNPKGKLRTLELVSYPEKGYIRAADLLFLSKSS